MNRGEKGEQLTVLHNSIVVARNRFEISRNDIQLLIDLRNREDTSRQAQERRQATINDVFERSASFVAGLMFESRERRSGDDERVEGSSGSGERSRVVPAIVPFRRELISSILIEPSFVYGRSDRRLYRGMTPLGD